MDTIQLIHNFNPRTQLQKDSKKLILSELEKYGNDLYFRESLHGHMTASAIVLNPSLNKTLMIYHNIYNSYAWTGGHADGDLDLFQVAYREVCEETGVKKLYPISRALLSVEALPVPEHIKRGKKVDFHHHYNVTFGFICPENQTLQIKPDENSSVSWLDISSLSEMCSEKEMVPVYEDNIQQIQRIMAEKLKNYENLPDKLLPWYQSHARDLPWRKNQDPYRVWLSEIMLQQTRVDTVIDYYTRFLTAFPTIKELAAAEEEQVLKLWEGLGYYSRARNLQKCAKIIMEEYNGVFPSVPEEINQLPGIGTYTTGAIASICFNQAVPAVDGNVLRVISRITEDYRCIDEESTKKETAKELQRIYPKDRCGDFTQSLMELGATICLPNGEPLCSQCPAADMCMANSNGTYSLLPVRKEKQPRKIQDMTFFILTAGDKIAVRKRAEKGVLHDLWELPNVSAVLNKSDAMDWLSAWGGMGTVSGTKKGKHIFTHIQWNIQCYEILCPEPFGEFIWADKSTLENDISLPTAFKKFLDKPSEPYTQLTLE